MPTHTLARKDSSQHGPIPAQQSQQAFAMPTHIVSRKNSPNMPTVGEESDNSGGATAKAKALYAPVQAPDAPQQAESGAAPPPAQSAESSASPAAGTEAARPPLPHVPSGAPTVCVSADPTLRSLLRTAQSGSCIPPARPSVVLAAP